MKEALRLAQKARGMTAPNPMVGAVLITLSGEVLGRGFHPKAGSPHAEVLAIRDAAERHSPSELAQAILYVTLEPCGHFGKTPPCAELILKTGIKKVVVGCLDPNPLMQGKSIEKLRAAGVDVTVGEDAIGAELHQECVKLIRGFRSVIENKRPFVTIKCATSLDGKIATATGESQWITEEPARLFGQRERSEHDTILVGVGTVIADNPQLNVRLEGEKRVLRKVILDTTLRTPPNARVFESGDPVIIYCDWNYSKERRDSLERVGATVVPLGAPDRKFSLDALQIQEILADLARRGSQEVMVEGGARVLGAFVREKLFDRIVYFIAPKILGSESRDVFEGVGLKHLDESIKLENLSARLVGKDLVIEGSRSCLPV